MQDTRKRTVAFRIGDRIAFIAGISLTVLLISFFSWRMMGNLKRDRALTPVPTSTSTFPLR